MTKQEAQTIIDEIDPTTVVDHNWLGYLIADPEFKILKAIHVIFDMAYYLFLEKYEGYSMEEFQTKQEIYVGKVINYFNAHYLIISQYDGCVQYINEDGDLSHLDIKGIESYLI